MHLPVTVCGVCNDEIGRGIAGRMRFSFLFSDFTLHDVLCWRVGQEDVLPCANTVPLMVRE